MGKNKRIKKYKALITLYLNSGVKVGEMNYIGKKKPNNGVIRTFLLRENRRDFEHFSIGRIEELE
jgi:hypothetical protein